MLGYFSLYHLNFLFSLSPSLTPVGELLALNDISLCKQSVSSLPSHGMVAAASLGWELGFVKAGCVQGGGGRCWALGFHGSPVGLQGVVCTSGSGRTFQSFLHA